MDENLEKIKAKIKKLLALSNSPNPNEAASALKMAQEMMAEYNVEKFEVGNINISEEKTPSYGGNSPPIYETLLIFYVSTAFGCKYIHSYSRENYWKHIWVFIGLSHRAEVAAYITQILLRKLKTARKEYIKSLYRVRSKYRKTQRADDFCKAWVSTISDKLITFAQTSIEEDVAIESFVNKNYPNLGKLNSTDRSFGRDIDSYKGREAGKGVQLQHGVGVHNSQGSFLIGG